MNNNNNNWLPFECSSMFGPGMYGAKSLTPIPTTFAPDSNGKIHEIPDFASIHEAERQRRMRNPNAPLLQDRTIVFPIHDHLSNKSRHREAMNVIYGRNPPKNSQPCIGAIEPGMRMATNIPRHWPLPLWPCFFFFWFAHVCVGLCVLLFVCGRMSGGTVIGLKKKRRVSKSKSQAEA